MKQRYLSIFGLLFLCTTPAMADDTTLGKVARSSNLTLGYRESSVPFSYLGKDQKPVGISIDLCREVASAVLAKYPNTNVEWVAVNASNRIPLLQNGTIDLECGSTTNTVERQKQVAFSVATFASQVSWLVDGKLNITSEANLRNKTAVVTQGSLNAQVLEKLNQEKHLDLHIQHGKEQAESLMLLRSGRAAGWLEDDILQAGLVASSPNSADLKFIPSSYTTASYYGLMMRKDDPDFKKLVDDTIIGLMKNGSYVALYEKWFEKPIPPSNISLHLPMSNALKERVKSPSDALAP
ncbi:amino acid ABC transporter substrate-binding protein [Thalassospira mesophila]|uniref:Solute-binding protein family 3/N-terminal domain-containing protein n=1 Tax=Thalassospira mesophila TaxID=1293891 RepID=A0A1Y2KZY2_9PROT|nr:amino acid ABC transporter substrate-binding protein [Thalassospira mesophila]OSQ37356.1 hypothetical protein TMES_14110 [Thalassospira mesophila]